MDWFTLKNKKCVHCQQTKTNNMFEGQLTCTDCQSFLLMSREDVRYCPVDKSPMKKETHDTVIIDRCTECNGVWLDQNELKKIKALAAANADFAAGMVVGMSF